MSTLRERLEAMSPEDRQHTLLAMTELLYGSPSEHPALCRLVKRRDWYEAKRTLVNDQAYARDLDLALQAAQTDTVPLGDHLILSLLRATLNTLASRMPATAVEALSRAGERDRAAYFAGQRADPAYRCEALCGVALGAQRRGDLVASARALDRAREAAEGVNDPATQAELLCTIALGYDRGNRPPQAQSALVSAAECLPSIVDDRQRTHACAYVARVGEDLEQENLAYQATRTIRAIYEQHAVPRRDGERGTGGERWTWDVARYARNLALLDQPDYLLALASWDQTRERRIPSDYYADIPALVLRTAAANGDRVTCQAVIDEALAHKPRNSLIDLPPVMVEALAETGYGERARAVVEQAVADGLDTSLLCTAWAKGAGAAGDIEAVLAAADLASPGGGFEGLGIRLAQRVTGQGNQYRLGVLVAGYSTLAARDPDRAEVLWRRATETSDAQTRLLLREHSGAEKRSGTALGYLDRLLALRQRLPGSADWIDDLVNDGLDALIFSQNWERAIEVAERLPEEVDRTLAFESITQGLLKAGDVPRALEVAERIPMASSRREMLGQVAGAQAPSHGSSATLESVVRESERLDEDERIHRTGAWPALVGAFARKVGPARALARIESLGPEAVSAAFVSLAEATMEAGDEATASRLLSMAERGGRDNEHAVRLASMAVVWAERQAWRPLAQRVLRLAWGYGQPYLFPHVHLVLCDLARAARALADRSALHSLLEEIRPRLQRNQVSPEYGVPVAERALVQIAAGQVATGELLKRETLYDAPVLQSIRSPLYKSLAWAEMAVALERVPSDKLNPRRPGDLLDRLVDRVGTWLGEEDIEDEQSLGFKQEMYLKNALKALPWGPAAKSPPGKYAVLQATQFTVPRGAIQDAPPNALHSSAQPLSRLIEILAHCGQHEQIGQVVAATPYRSDLPVVATAAVRALIDAGLPDEARQVVMALPEGTDRTWIDVELGRIRAPREATIAMRTALQGQWTDEGLAAVARVASGLEETRRRRIVGEMLRLGRDRGRRALLAAVAALVSEKDLLAPGGWNETFEEILSTDGWWTA